MAKSPAKEKPKAKAPAKKKPAKKSRKGIGGRPTKMTPKTIQLLEECFMDGLSDTEACIVADISTSLLYAYGKEHPEFLERKELLKRTPAINAKRTVARDVKVSPKSAMTYLERNPKTRDEWAPPTVKQDISLKGELAKVKDDDLDERIATLEKELKELEGGAGNQG